MALAVAIQMDPIDTINIDADSTFALALEAQARGHALFHYLPAALTLHDGRLYARARPLEVMRRQGNHHRFGAFEELDLAGVDVILMRQDPPFDMAYITATHLLDLLPENGPLVVNDPAAVRNAPEKLFVLRFKELMPPTLLTRDRDAIRAFWKEHGDIILKPLFGNGGAGVFRLRPGDENLTALLEMYESILVEGKAMGAVLRVPPEGEARANLHVGARPVKTELTARDREICAAIGPTLRAEGLVFVGIDVIGDWLTEINVTSPTGIQEIARLDGIEIAPKIWDAIEARLAERANRIPA
jgi:glutathione synthase